MIGGERTIRHLNTLEIPQPQTTLILLLLGGAIAQLLSAWLRLPSIVLLLLTGFLLGPEVLGYVQPSFLDAFRPTVIQLLVAIIMFEGGLSLRLKEMKEHGRVVRNLLTFGVILTFLGGFAAAFFLMNLTAREAAVFASLTVVTGPTVILPLLKRLNAQESIQSILKWEGILIDPLGSILTVLCLDLALAPDFHISKLAAGFAYRIILGVLLGITAGFVTGWLYRWRFLLGHAIGELGGTLGLALALCVYGISDAILPESGLIAVTAFGLWLGHTKFPFKHEIMAFKEQVTTVAISTAFVWLSSSIRLSDLTGILPSGLLTVAVLLFGVRPASVWLSSWGSELSFREKTFLSLIAPRGIVAASFAFFAADSLAQAKPGTGAILVPLTFLTIILSVLWTGFLGSPLASLLKVRKPHPRGLLLVGANSFARWVALQLSGRIQEIKLIDTDETNIRLASQEGLFVYHGDATQLNILEKLDLKGIGKLLAATGQRDTNIFSCQIAGRILGYDRIFRLEARERDRREQEVGAETWGSPLTSIPLKASELLDLAENNRLWGTWKKQKSWWPTPPPDTTPTGPWTLLAVHKGSVLFPTEGRIPRGADILEIQATPPNEKKVVS